MNVAALQPRRHDAPPGWPPEVFERVTAAIAQALVAAYYRRAAEWEAGADEARAEDALP